jgi:branched-chain amino acid transport system substrate-binding protein
LKIGAVIDMTSTRGLQDKKWFDLFAKLYNDAGGWKIGNDTYQVQMITYDSQGNTTTAKDELNRLVIQDGCKFIIGQISTGSAAVDTTVTEPNHVITIHEDLTNLAAGPQNQYFYTTGNFFGGATMYKIDTTMASLGYKSYVSVKPDNQVGRAMDPVLNLAWASAAPNIKYLGTVWVGMTTIDYGPIATKILSMNPDIADLMYEGFIPNSVPQTYRALYDVGYKGIILAGMMSDADLAAIVTQTGKAAVEGGMQSGMGLDPRKFQKDPRMLSIFDAYEKQYGKFETDGITETTGWFILEAAINATQSVDVDVIKNYLDNSPPPIQVASGRTTLFARADLGNYRTKSCAQSFPLGQILNGEVVPGPFVTTQDQYLVTILSQNMTAVYKAYWDKYGYPTFPAAEKGLSSIKWSDLGITGRD